MHIHYSVSYTVIILCFLMSPTLIAATNDESKISLLEQRILVLEKALQSLASKNLKRSSDKSEHTTATQNKNDAQEINQKKIAELREELNVINETYQEAELAIYSYDALAEEFNNSIKVAGYADIEYKGSNAENAENEFRMHHLSLFFTKNFDNNIKFFSEIEYEDAPKFAGVDDGSGGIEVASGKIFVEAVNFDWNQSQYFNMRLGRFFTPAGIWSEDHYPPFVTTQERPLHIRKIFPQLVDGMSIFGSTELVQDHFFNYTAYLGNGESNTNLSAKKDLNSSKGLGFKGDYYAPWLDELLLGFTLYQDNKDSANNDARKKSYGSHIKLRQSNLILQAEYAKSNLIFDNALNNYQSEGYYAQLTYELNQWGLGYRYDVFDKKDAALEQITRNSIFINFHVNANFTIKGEYHHDSYDDPIKKDEGFYILSITGYLGR